VTSHPAGISATISATLSTMVVVFPTFLLGAFAVFVRRDLGMGLSELGAAVSAYFIVSAFASIPAGVAVQRFGSRKTTTVAVVIVAISFAGVSLAPTFPLLLLSMATGGIGNALGQVSSNHTLSMLVPLTWQGRAFGIKQASVPACGFIASLALPIFGGADTWRFAFASAAGFGLLALLRLPARPLKLVVVHNSDEARVVVLPLVFVGLGAMLASAAANALSIFIVDWAVAEGMDIGLAAVTLAIASTTGILGRLAIGWFADRTARSHLTTVAVQVGCGALGVLLISSAVHWLIIVGAMIGYGLGWSWAGLIHYAVARLNPHAPARATSIVQTGMYTGGAMGPVLFGMLADSTSTQAAWLVTALIMLVASVSLWAAGRNLAGAAAERPAD
jgi:MFS family permease